MESDPDLTHLQMLLPYRKVLNFVHASDTDQKDMGTEVPRAGQSAGIVQGSLPGSFSLSVQVPFCASLASGK